MKIKCSQRVLVVTMLCVGLTLPALAQQNPGSAPVGTRAADKPLPPQRPSTPLTSIAAIRRARSLATHLHTAMSFDAGMFGARLGPIEAYRFARGEEVIASTGKQCDFRVHWIFLSLRITPISWALSAYFSAAIPRFWPTRKDAAGMKSFKTASPARPSTKLLSIYGLGKISAIDAVPAGQPGLQSAWVERFQAAEDFNEPGRFTAFIGYEWTSNTGGNNLHRNVIFRDNGGKADQVDPYTTMRHWAATTHGICGSGCRPTRKDRRRRARHRAQRQPFQWPHVSDRSSRSPASRSTGICRNAREVGALYEVDPDQGRRRGPSVPLAQRRVCRFRTLGLSAISMAAMPRSRTCWSLNMPARR